MVNINVNIQDSLVVSKVMNESYIYEVVGTLLDTVPQELQNTKHNIIHIAKPRSFTFLCVMETSRPIDGNISFTVQQFVCRTYGSASRYGAELKQAFKNRTILSYID